MAVSEQDVRHVAELARLGLDPVRVESLVRELNGILAHMDELRAVETGQGDAGRGTGDEGPERTLPLRADEGPQLALSRDRADFAPEMRDGFYLVPRLATHEGEGERSP